LAPVAIQFNVAIHGNRCGPGQQIEELVLPAGKALDDAGSAEL
jgi:hypothetical protein